MDIKTFFNMLLKNTPFAVVGRGDDKVSVNAGMGVAESAKWRPKWKIEKYDAGGMLYAVEEFAGNMLLDEGVTEMWNLIIGESSGYFNAGNTYIGIGNSAIEASSSQTGLQGSSKLYKIVDSTYPRINNRAFVARATFGPDEAAFAWNEFTLANGNSDNAVNLCRKVENHGVKASADTWVLSLSITLS